MPEQAPIGSEPRLDLPPSDIEVRRRMFREFRAEQAKSRAEVQTKSQQSSSRSASIDVAADGENVAEAQEEAEQDDLLCVTTPFSLPLISAHML